MSMAFHECHKPREGRAQASLRQAAGALASDAGACAEVREMAADFLMAEN